MHYAGNDVNKVSAVINSRLFLFSGLEGIELLIIRAIKKEASDYRSEQESLLYRRRDLGVDAYNLNTLILEVADTDYGFELRVVGHDLSEA